MQNVNDPSKTEITIPSVRIGSGAGTIAIDLSQGDYAVKATRIHRG